MIGSFVATSASRLDAPAGFRSMALHGPKSIVTTGRHGVVGEAMNLSTKFMKR